MQYLTKSKRAIGGVLGAGIIAAGAYSIGTITSSPSASATYGGGDYHNSRGESALVVDAVEYHLNGQGVPAESNQIYAVQVNGDNARGKLFNADSGSIFYAHKADGRWQVVYQTQDSLPGNVTSQYGMPNEWTDQSF